MRAIETAGLPAMIRTPGTRPRPREQVVEHYEIERALADRLRRAGREERRDLYAEVYDELFRRLPHHPQNVRVSDPAAGARGVRRQMALLRRFLRPGLTFLEIGAGDCGVALEVAKVAGRVFAVEASAAITGRVEPPSNFELVLTRGFSLPLPEASVDLAYSNQLMEHLHPEDASEQLREVARVLRPGGRYVCVTPNALSGPHDVSAAFDDDPTGFHLKEYSVRELVDAFRLAGFAGFRVVIGARGVYLPFSVPAAASAAFERLLLGLSRGWRRRVARTVPGRLALGINLVATR